MSKRDVSSPASSVAKITAPRSLIPVSRFHATQRNTAATARCIRSFVYLPTSRNISAAPIETASDCFASPGPNSETPAHADHRSRSRPQRSRWQLFATLSQTSPLPHLRHRAGAVSEVAPPWLSGSRVRSELSPLLRTEARRTLLLPTRPRLVLAQYRASTLLFVHWHAAEVTPHSERWSPASPAE